MPEPVRPVAGDEATPLERDAGRLDLGQGHAQRHGMHRLRGEHVPADRGVAEHGPLGRIERVEAGAEERVDRRRQGVVAGPLARVGGQLLQEQRVAGGRLGDAAERGRVERPGRDGLEDAPALGNRERAQVENAAPGAGRTGIPELGPGQADEHPSALAVEAGDRLHELQQPGPGPLGVVENDHDGELAGQGAEQPPQGPRRLVAGRSRPEARDGREPVADLRREAERRGGLGGGASGARLRDDVAERAASLALAVRRAAATQDRGAGGKRRPELGGEPRLADPRLPDHRDDDPRPLPAGAVVGLAQRAELAPAADQRTAEAAPDGRCVVDQALEPVGAVTDRLAACGMLHEGVGRAGQADLAMSAGQCLGRRDRIAEERRCGRAARGGDDAGTHPGGRPEAGAERRCGGRELERDPRRSQRVVLVRDRDAEHGHGAVGAKVGDGPAVPPARAGHLTVIPLHEPAQRFRVDARGTVGRDEAGDETRDPPPVAHGVRRRGRAPERVGDVVPEDLGLERPQRGARLEAEAVQERAAGRPVGGERVGLPAAPVEGQHVQLPDALVQRMLVHERLELRKMAVGARGEVGRDALGGALEAEGLDARDLGLREGLAANVGEGRPPPQAPAPPRASRPPPPAARPPAPIGPARREPRSGRRRPPRGRRRCRTRHRGPRRHPCRPRPAGGTRRSAPRCARSPAVRPPRGRPRSRRTGRPGRGGRGAGRAAGGRSRPAPEPARGRRDRPRAAPGCGTPRPRGEDIGA